MKIITTVRLHQVTVEETETISVVLRRKRSVSVTGSPTSDKAGADHPESQNAGREIINKTSEVNCDENT